MTTDDASAKAHSSRLGRGFWTLATSSGLSNLADGIFKMALPLLGVQLTQSPLLIAGLAVALSLPWLLFALTAGALADRLDRQKLMIMANTVRAIVAGLIGAMILFDVTTMWILYVVALLIGIAETLYDTSAQSILPSVVARDDLSRANGRLYGVELTANQFIGPPLGGALVAIGIAAGFLTPALLWLAAVGFLLLLRGSFRVAREQKTTLRFDIAEGLRFLWSKRVLRILAIMTGVVNFASSAAFAVIVLFAVGPNSRMHLSEVQFGVLLTASAIGALIGSVVASWIEGKLGKRLSLMLAVVGMAIFTGAPGVTANPFAIGAAFFIGGVLVVLWNVITVSLRQRITPDRLLGRVNSAYRLLAWGTMPIGAAVGGLLASWLGLEAMFAIMGILALAMLGFAPFLSDKAIRDAEDPAA